MQKIRLNLACPSYIHTSYAHTTHAQQKLVHHHCSPHLYEQPTLRPHYTSKLTFTCNGVRQPHAILQSTAASPACRLPAAAPPLARSTALLVPSACKRYIGATGKRTFIGVQLFACQPACHAHWYLTLPKLQAAGLPFSMPAAHCLDYEERCAVPQPLVKSLQMHGAEASTTPTQCLDARLSASALHPCSSVRAPLARNGSQISP